MKANLIQNDVRKGFESNDRKPNGLSEAKWEEMEAKSLSSYKFFSSMMSCKGTCRGGNIKRNMGKVGITLHG